MPDIKDRLLLGLNPRFLRLGWTRFSLPCIGIWLIYWLVFFPGLLEFDSIEQWGQMVRFSFNDWHPVFHTLTNWLITRIWFSPAAISLFQIIALSLSIGFLLSRLEHIGIPESALWITSFVFALSPVNGTMAIFLVKDILYSTSLLWLTALNMLAITSEGRWLLHWQNLILTGVVAALTALFRHNGIFVASGSILLLGLAYRSFWKQIILVFTVCFAIFGVITGPLYHALRVEREPYMYWLQQPVHQIAAAIAAGTVITSREARFLNEILPLAKWKSLYNAYSINPITEDRSFRGNIIENNLRHFKQVWLSVITRNPRALLRHHLRASSLVWEIFQPKEADLYCVSITIPPNKLGLTRSTRLPAVYRAAVRFIDMTTVPPYAWFIWQPALYLYITLAFSILLVIRFHNLKWFLLFSPIFINSISVFLVSFTQEFRYMYPAYLTGLLSICLMYWIYVNKYGADLVSSFVDKGRVTEQ